MKAVLGLGGNIGDMTAHLDAAKAALAALPHTTVLREDIEKVPGLRVIASSEEAGVYAITNKEGRQIFITGHSEYDADTLNKEYVRDKNLGLPIRVPVNYFPDDDDTQDPIVRWRGHANLLFSNWLNYFVYQTTPYDIKKIGK